MCFYCLYATHVLPNLTTFTFSIFSVFFLLLLLAFYIFFILYIFIACFLSSECFFFVFYKIVTIEVYECVNNQAMRFKENENEIGSKHMWMNVWNIFFTFLFCIFFHFIFRTSLGQARPKCYGIVCDEWFSVEWI